MATLVRQALADTSVIKDDVLDTIEEMIARLDLAGCRVVEYPTTLEVRVLGQSKMKVLRTVWGHVGLLLDVARLRLRQATSVLTASP